MWYELQPLLETAGFDVLLVLDCCHAAGAVTKGAGSTMEILAGCSREGEAGGPGSSRALGSPFTHVLSKHLSESVPPCGLLISELFTLMSLDKTLEKQSPIHVVLSGHHNPIKLGPLLSAEELKEVKHSASKSMKPSLKALIAVSLRGDVAPDVGEFVQWLNSQCPEEFVDVEVERVDVEGSFASRSTLVLMSVPISIWAYLHGRRGFSLVGFVASRNMLAEELTGLKSTHEQTSNALDAMKACNQELEGKIGSSQGESNEKIGNDTSLSTKPEFDPALSTNQKRIRELEAELAVLKVKPETDSKSKASGLAASKWAVSLNHLH